MEQAGIKVDAPALKRLVGRLREAAGRAGDRDPQARRPRVQRRLAQAARRDAVRRAEAAGRQAQQDRRLGDRRRRARRPRRAGPSAAGEDPRAPPARQAQGHLHRRAGARARRQDRPHPHLLSHDRRGDRPARLDRSQPAEHPGAHRGGPQDPPGLHRREGPQAAVSADYSQIELRLLAHVADLASLKEAFARGDDIHAITAREMFGVPVKGMDPLVRRRAKAINFGIIYGISAFGLANQLGIGQQRGARLHRQVFPALSRHPRLHGDDQGLRAQARLRDDAVRPQDPPEVHQRQEPGHARLLRARRDQRAAAGRRRRHHQARDDPRAAARSRTRSLKARMLLQVHDELLFEVPDKEIDKTKDGRPQGDGERRDALGAAGRRHRRRPNWAAAH